MERVNIAQARERLEELIERAAAGETIVIERGAEPGVRLGPGEVAASKAAPKFDAEKHRRWLAEMPMDPRSQEQIIADLRSLDRY